MPVYGMIIVQVKPARFSEPSSYRLLRSYTPTGVEFRGLPLEGPVSDLLAAGFEPISVESDVSGLGLTLRQELPLRHMASVVVPEWSKPQDQDDEPVVPEHDCEGCIHDSGKCCTLEGDAADAVQPYLDCLVPRCPRLHPAS